MNSKDGFIRSKNRIRRISGVNHNSLNSLNTDVNKIDTDIFDKIREVFGEAVDYIKGIYSVYI